MHCGPLLPYWRPHHHDIVWARYGVGTLVRTITVRTWAFQEDYSGFMIRERSRCWIWAVTSHLLRSHPPLVCLKPSEWLCAQGDLMLRTFQTHKNLCVTSSAFLIWWRSCTEPMSGIDLTAVKNTMCVWVRHHAGVSANYHRPSAASYLMQTEQTLHWSRWQLGPHSVTYGKNTCSRHPALAHLCYVSKVHSLLRGLWGTRSQRNMRAAPGRVLPQNRPSDLIGQETFCLCW